MFLSSILLTMQCQFSIDPQQSVASTPRVGALRSILDRRINQVLSGEINAMRRGRRLPRLYVIHNVKVPIGCNLGSNIPARKYDGVYLYSGIQRFSAGMLMHWLQ